MPARRLYPGEFREQLVELVRAGRTPESLARGFEPSAQTIRNWAKQADQDGGRRSDGLTSAEQQELRRETRQLKLEREILSKWRPGLHGRPARFRRLRESVQIREGLPGRPPGRAALSPRSGLPEWFYAWPTRPVSARAERQ